jgi:hypothetical protein
VRIHEPGSIERTITFGIQRIHIAISRGQNRGDQLFASSKRNVRISFQSQRSAPHAATLWGVSTIQVPQVAFGKSRNVDTQFPANSLSDIEKRSRFFAMRRVGSINGDAETVLVVSGTDGVYAAVGSDSPECSASRSAIARDVRSRSTIAAIAPHTTARNNAIQENRVSQRSAAMPA